MQKDWSTWLALAVFADFFFMTFVSLEAMLFKKGICEMELCGSYFISKLHSV